jgi:hypothetical protein
MSNVTLFNAGQVPDFVKRRGGLSDVAKSLAAGGGSAGKRISIKGGVFRLISGGKEVAAIEERHLDVVIVNAAPTVNRVFYMKKFDKDAQGQAPDCWSADGVTPSPDSESKQASSCNECPQNIAGSGNGNSRACRYQQRLAVVLANDVSGDVLQLALPATSIFGKENGDSRPLKAYATWLTAQNVDPTDVVTRMKFDTTSESPKLFFKAMRYLTDAEHDDCQKQAKSDDALKAITMTVSKMDKAPQVAAPIEGVKPKAAKPVIAPETDEEEAPPPPKKTKASPKAEAVEEAEEPVVRKEEKKPSAVPSAKAALSSMVDDWDDE